MKIKEWFKSNYAGWFFLLFSCGINLALVLVISDTKESLQQCQQEVVRSETQFPIFTPVYPLPEPCSPCVTEVNLDTTAIEMELWSIRNAINDK